MTHIFLIHRKNSLAYSNIDIYTHRVIKFEDITNLDILLHVENIQINFSREISFSRREKNTNLKLELSKIYEPLVTLGSKRKRKRKILC